MPCCWYTSIPFIKLGTLFVGYNDPSVCNNKDDDDDDDDHTNN